jgi:protein-S-isoprenylcysteine O-methyltransferase Ste14
VDIVGKSPIPLPILLIGKIAVFTCALFPVVKLLNLDTMLYDSSVTLAIGLIIYALGLSIVIVSLIHLGQSAAVGIPERNTELKTHGLYRLTRNPVYVGAFTTCAGSCLFSIHIINFALFAIAIEVHHQIVMKEEEFLEKRFGQQWLNYRQHVPRYLVRIGRSKAPRKIN